MPIHLKPRPPKIYIFGGGYIGSSITSTRRVTSMSGYADSWWSRDGSHWYKISYEEGKPCAAACFCCCGLEKMGWGSFSASGFLPTPSDLTD